MGNLETLYWPGVDAPRPQDRRSGNYYAYLPDSITLQMPIFETNASRAALIERKIRALETMDTAGLESISRFLLRSEALASSQIEGLEASPKNVAIAEFRLNESGTEQPRGTAAEIARNIEAIRWAISHLAELENITPNDLVEVHSRLITDQDMQGIRTTQNWVGGSDWHPLDAEFVPPPPQTLGKQLDTLCSYLSGAGHGALIQAALAHAQLETLHPFADGNGRIGRALIHTVFIRRGIARNGILPISAVLHTRSDVYVRGLNAFRCVGDDGGNGLNAWISTFLDACEDSVSLTVDFHDQIRQLEIEWHKKFREFYDRDHVRAPKSGSAPLLIIDALSAMPLFSAAAMAATIGKAERMVADSCAELERANILAPISIRRGLRGWFQPAVFDLIRAGERKLSSTMWNTMVSPPNRPTPRL